MKKENKKGFTLVEIIIASVIALVVAGFLITITIKLVNKNNDYYKESQLLADKNIITKEIMDDINNPEQKLKSIIQKNTGEIVFTFEKIDAPNIEIERPLKVTKSEGKITISYNKIIKEQNDDGTITSTMVEFNKKLNTEGNIDNIITSVACTEGDMDAEGNCTKKDANVDIELPIYTNYSDEDYGIKINIPYKTDEVKVIIPDFKNNETLCEKIVKDKLGLGSLINKKDTPDFSKTSCSSGCEENTVGIFTAEDGLGTSCYFRGDIKDNYVKFGKRYDGIDIIWRIVRINGDGSTRIIYDHIDSSDSNVNYTAWEAPVSYSNYQDRLDNFYTEVVISNGLNDYVMDDAIYCNDNKVNETLSCLNESKKQVGLISRAELAYSGIGTNGGNVSSHNFLWSSYSYWTSSRGTYAQNRKEYRVYSFINESITYSLETPGHMGTDYEKTPKYTQAIKPVISLKTDTTFVGSGTINDPFVIK